MYCTCTACVQCHAAAADDDDILNSNPFTLAFPLFFSVIYNQLFWGLLFWTPWYLGLLFPLQFWKSGFQMYFFSSQQESGLNGQLPLPNIQLQFGTGIWLWSHYTKNTQTCQAVHVYTYIWSNFFEYLKISIIGIAADKLWRWSMLEDQEHCWVQHVWNFSTNHITWSWTLASSSVL